MYTLDYCKKNLEYLDEGSSRAVYALNEFQVVKVPIITGGYIQNRNELHFHSVYKNKLPICAIHKSSTEDYIIMERVRAAHQLDDSDFNMFIFDDILTIFLGTKIEDRPAFFENNKNIDSRIMKFMEELSKYDLDVLNEVLYDVCCYNVGLDSNDRIVVLDYGYPESLHAEVEGYDSEYYDELGYTDDIEEELENL